MLPQNCFQTLTGYCICAASKPYSEKLLFSISLSYTFALLISDYLKAFANVPLAGMWGIIAKPVFKNSVTVSMNMWVKQPQSPLYVSRMLFCLGFFNLHETKNIVWQDLAEYFHYAGEHNATHSSSSWGSLKLTSSLPGRYHQQILQVLVILYSPLKIQMVWMNKFLISVHLQELILPKNLVLYFHMSLLIIDWL